MLKRLFPSLLLFLSPFAAPAGVAAASVSIHPLATFAATTQAVPGYSASDIQTAYDVSPLLNAGLDGTGQTIALLEGGSFNQSDIAKFDAANGLPDPTIDESYVGGSQATLERSSSSRGETTLDLEWAHALAPGAGLHVYYVNSSVATETAYWRNVAAAVTQAVNDGAGTISMSFGVCSPNSGAKLVQTALAAALRHGVNTFVASGDTGAYAGPKKDCGNTPGVAYPASDPSVVSVGGTSLQLNGDGTIATETAWNLSGGGKGVPFLRPVWQVAPQLRPGKYRQVPDVAFDADLNTGVQLVYNNRPTVAGGTSLGAPAWAGIWSLIEQDASQHGKRVGSAPSAIYRIANSASYASAFHDITAGGNRVYHAHSGWDRVTGWGTPDVNNLAAAVLAIS